MPNHPKLSLIEHFQDLPDPRVHRTKDHDLIDLLVIAVCTLLCAGESFNDLEDFGHAKHDWFKTFLTLRNGIPSHDTFNRLFAALDPKAFLDLLPALDAKPAAGRASGDRRAGWQGAAPGEQCREERQQEVWFCFHEVKLCGENYHCRTLATTENMSGNCNGRCFCKAACFAGSTPPARGSPGRWQTHVRLQPASVLFLARDSSASLSLNCARVAESILAALLSAPDHEYSTFETATSCPFIGHRSSPHAGRSLALVASARVGPGMGHQSGRLAE